jgi:hypothetical protein
MWQRWPPTAADTLTIVDISWQIEAFNEWFAEAAQASRLTLGL